MYLGDEFASSVFGGDQDLLQKLLSAFKVADNPRGFLNKAKVALQLVNAYLFLDGHSVST